MTIVLFILLRLSYFQIKLLKLLMLLIYHVTPEQTPSTDALA